jgi:hypothetical protein
MARLLIDGYNLMHAAGLVPRDVRHGDLERGRRRLMEILWRSLDIATREQTVVVFDGRATADSVESTQWQSMTIRFADGSADELIVKLIQKDANPKQLHVVSSDHLLQKTASRRGATSIESDQFLNELEKQIHRSTEKLDKDDPGNGAKPTETLTANEVQEWLNAFEEPNPPC